MKNSCRSGKRIFEDKHLAEEALIQFHIGNHFSNSNGPINVYQCEECGFWHFTSKGIKSQLLKDEHVKARIKLGRTAFDWERKLK